MQLVRPVGLRQRAARIHDEDVVRVVLLHLRERVGKDRRSVEVRLTPAGRKEADRTMAIVGSAMHDRVTRLPARRRDQANQSLDDLIAILLD